MTPTSIEIAASLAFIAFQCFLFQWLCPVQSPLPLQCIVTWRSTFLLHFSLTLPFSLFLQLRLAIPWALMVFSYTCALQMAQSSTLSTRRSSRTCRSPCVIILSPLPITHIWWRTSCEGRAVLKDISGITAKAQLLICLHQHLSSSTTEPSTKFLHNILCTSCTSQVSSWYTLHRSRSGQNDVWIFLLTTTSTHVYCAYLPWREVSKWLGILFPLLTDHTPYSTMNRHRWYCEPRCLCLLLQREDGRSWEAA